MTTPPGTSEMPASRHAPRRRLRRRTSRTSAIGVVVTALVVPGACFLVEPSEDSFDRGSGGVDSGGVDSGPEVASGPCGSQATGASTLLYCAPGSAPYALTFAPGDTAHLYFTDSTAGAVSRLDLTGSLPVSAALVRAGLGTPGPLTSGGGDLYFAAEGSDASFVGGVAPDGGGFTSTSEFGGNGTSAVNAMSFSTEQRRVFFTAHDRVWSWSPDAGAPNTIGGTIAQASIGPVATFDQEFNTIVFWGADSALHAKYPTVAPGNLVTDAGEPAGIYVASNPSGGEIVAWTVAGSPGHVIFTSAGVSGTAASSSIAIPVAYANFGIVGDGTAVYFASDTGVSKLLLPSGPTAVALALEASLSGCDYGVAVDATYVYFVCNTAAVGKIYRLAK